MSDTPETDLMLDNQCHDDVRFDDACSQLAELCRSLERERDEARRLLAAAKESLNAIHVEVGGWIAAIMKEGK
jgi:hypothetical protein